MMDWRGVPSLAALRGFEAAVRHKSLSQAAAELNVTHAAIAQNVRNVEAHLGVGLLNRAGRGMAPTPAGAQLAEALSEAFGGIVAACRAVDTAQRTGPLSITVTPSFAENWLMGHICDFWCRHPDIAVTLSPSTDLSDLRRDGHDLGIRYGRGDWQGLDSTYLFGAEFVVVGAPSLVGDADAVDLSRLTWLFDGVVTEHRLRAESDGLLAGPERIRELPTMALVMSATLAGAGVSVWSRSLVAERIESGRLIVLHQFPQDGVGYHMVTLPGPKRPPLQTFIKWLKAEAAA